MIQVDRLVLDLPAVTPARAERLSRAIGAMLGARGPTAPGDRVEVRLPPGAASDEAILAALDAALRARAR